VLDPVPFATAQIVSVACFSTLAAATEQPLTGLAALSASVWGVVVFLALTGTVLALLIQSWAQRFTTPSHTGLLFAFEPVAAAFAAYLLLGETMTGRQAAGATLILAGIVMAELNHTARETHALAAPEGQP
jgi:drug/metabolite transporter (DMT)-like permease